MAELIDHNQSVQTSQYDAAKYYCYHRILGSRHHRLNDINIKSSTNSTYYIKYILNLLLDKHVHIIKLYSMNGLCNNKSIEISQRINNILHKLIKIDTKYDTETVIDDYTPHTNPNERISIPRTVQSLCITIELIHTDISLIVSLLRNVKFEKKFGEIDMNRMNNNLHHNNKSNKQQHNKNNTAKKHKKS